MHYWGELGECFDLTKDEVRNKRVSSGEDGGTEDCEVNSGFIKEFIGRCEHFMPGERLCRDSRDSRGAAGGAVAMMAKVSHWQSGWPKEIKTNDVFLLPSKSILRSFQTVWRTSGSGAGWDLRL